MSTADSPRCVHFISGDLIFASRVRAAAESAGLSFELAMHPPGAPEGNPVTCVVLDLSTRSGLTDELMAACQTHCPGARVIAYGPHVQVGRLQAARAAGIPTVLTRGQFDAALPNLFSPT